MSDHENVGTEVFDAELFYSLSRPSRAKLTQVWEKAQGDENTLGDRLIGSYVGHVEDVLWGQGERKLTALVLEAAAARKERRETALTPPGACGGDPRTAGIRHARPGATIARAEDMSVIGRVVGDGTVVWTYETDAHGVTKASYETLSDAQVEALDVLEMGADMFGDEDGES